MNKENKEFFIEKNLWWLLLIIGLISLSVYFWKFHGVLANESDKWDHFGSYIGGIFSGMAFLALIAEMRANRKREKKQEGRYQKQINDLNQEKKEQDQRWAKESFERTFFMMLSQFNEKLSSLKELDINNIYDLIAINNPEFFYNIRNNVEENDKYSDINMLFINLYRILKFTDETHFEINEKKVYTNILRSYLSRKFLVILGFHLLYKDSSYNNYISYINKYNIFEHIDLKSLEIKMLKNRYLLSSDLLDESSNMNYRIILDYILRKKDGYIFENSNNLYLNFKIIKKNYPYGDTTEKFYEFVEAREKGIDFKFEYDNEDIEIYNYDFIFMHLIANFKPEAFANSLEYRDTTTIYNLYISELKNTYS